MSELMAFSLLMVRTKELSKAPDHIRESEGAGGVAIGSKLVTDSSDILDLLHKVQPVTAQLRRR